MTLPRYYAIRACWTAQPPLHLLAAAFLGLGRQGAGASQPAGDMGDLVAFLGADPASGRGAVLR